MIGHRQRHRHLAIGLLAELPAILMVHADRMGALLGIRRIVDNPDLDRSVTLDRRYHQLAHLGQHAFVRPLSFADEMQELLMLHRNAGRRRHRRHRLDALAAFRRQQSGAIIPQRQSPIRVPDHARQRLHISHKPICSIRRRRDIHPSPLRLR